MDGARISVGRIKAGSAAKAAESAGKSGRVASSRAFEIRADRASASVDDVSATSKPISVSLRPRGGRVFLSRAEVEANAARAQLVPEALFVPEAPLVPDARVSDSLIADNSSSSHEKDRQSASYFPAFSLSLAVDRFKRFLGLPS